QKNFIRRNSKQPVEKRRRPTAENYESDNETERQPRRRKHPHKRARTTQNNARQQRQIDCEKHVLVHRYAEYQLRFRIRSALVVEKDLADDGTRRDRRDTSNRQHFDRRKTCQVSENKCGGEVDADIDRSPGEDRSSGLNQTCDT